MKWQIWEEGYCISGGRGEARFLGESDGLTFHEAAIAFADKRRTEDDSFDKYFDSERLTYWGCGWFDNEAAARASFG